MKCLCRSFRPNMEKNNDQLTSGKNQRVSKDLFGILILRLNTAHLVQKNIFIIHRSSVFEHADCRHVRPKLIINGKNQKSIFQKHVIFQDFELLLFHL